MAKLSAEAKVGLLVLGGSVILLWMTMMVGKFEFGKPAGYRVTAMFDTVSGLDLKAAVRMAGVQIGTVETVELEDSKAKVILRINPDVKIPRGTEAAVKTMGLLGDKYVDLVPPQHKAEQGPAARERSGYYRDGDRIERSIAASDADQLISKLSAIADDIKQVTGSLRQVFGSRARGRVHGGHPARPPPDHGEHQGLLLHAPERRERTGRAPQRTGRRTSTASWAKTRTI